MPETAELELTIEQLSAESGVTTRNIRAYQTQGLLPAPVRRGRASAYDAEHLAQLEMIRDLRTQGIGLPAIERLMKWGEGIPAAELRAFASTLLQGLVLETPEVQPAFDAVDTWGDQVTPELIERSLATGLFRLEEDGSFVVLSPTLRAQGEELHEMGFSFEEAIEMTEALVTHLDAIAAAFTAPFVDRIVPSADAADSPREKAEALRSVAETVERVQPMATAAVNAAFRLVLQRHAERALAESLAEHSETDPEGKTR